MKRTRRSVPLLVVTGAVLLGGVAMGGTSPRGAAPVAVDVEDRDGRFEVTWAGDTFIGDAAEIPIAQHGYDWVMQEIAPLLGGDVVVVNAEAPITTLDEPFTPNKLYSYASDPAGAQALADAGVHVLGLSNNHALDQGTQGLLDTIAHGEAAGMVSFGAGTDDRQAERPLLLEGGDTTIGVVALAKGYGTRLTAGPGRAGTVPFSTASIARGYNLAKAAGADHVVAYVHWGENYRPEPVSDQLRDAGKFADAGYELVIGHGPHVMQGVEMIGPMPVVHSLGNFVFGTPGSYSEELPGYGLLADTRFGPDGLEELRLTCITVDNRKVDYQPTGCDEQEAGQALEDLGVSVTIDGITATVDLDAATDG
jgi:hypothetical protein